jgi:hypothetical protein
MNRENSISKRLMNRAISFNDLNIGSNIPVRVEPFVMASHDISDALQKLSLEKLKLNQFEFDEMFEEAFQYAKSCSIGHNDFHILESSTPDEKSNLAESEPACLPLPFLIAGSEAFRHKLLKLETDPIFCTLMMSSLSSFISEEQIRLLSRGGTEREVSRVGHKIFSSKLADSKKRWSYVVSGKLKVSLDSSSPFVDDSENDFFEIGAGEYFGGFGILKPEIELSHIVIETREMTKLLELNGDNLEAFVHKYEDKGKQLMSRMGGIPISSVLQVSLFFPASFSWMVHGGSCDDDSWFVGFCRSNLGILESWPLEPRC